MTGWAPWSPAAARATDIAVDLAATARLTRLIVTDTVPFGALRDRILARHPIEGQEVIGARPHIDTPGRAGASLASGRVLDTRLAWRDGEHVVVYAESTKIGELVTCPWCMSMWVGAFVIAARRWAPGLWDPVARVLAGSLAAGMVAHDLAAVEVELQDDGGD